MSDASVTELRKLNPNDLQTEVKEQRTLVSKLRSALRMGKEKNTQKYRSARKQLARMLTVQNTPTATGTSTPAK